MPFKTASPRIKMKFTYFTRPDGSKIAIDQFYVSFVRLPLATEQGNTVLEPQRQQVMETFEQVCVMLEHAHREKNK